MFAKKKKPTAKAAAPAPSPVLAPSESLEAPDTASRKIVPAELSSASSGPKSASSTPSSTNASTKSTAPSSTLSVPKSTTPNATTASSSSAGTTASAESATINTKASIRPGNAKSMSYSVYLNSTEISASRAALWPPTYDIRALNVFVANDKVFLEFNTEGSEDIAVRAEASQVIAVEDSTRYFILMQAHHEVTPKIIQNTGFAFYTREQAAQFLTFLKDEVNVDIPVVSASDFANVDVKHKELKIIPLINVEPEGYIQQEQVDEIEEFTKRELSSNASSMQQNPEQLVKLRESITLRLSRQGLGVFVSREEKRLSTKFLDSGKSSKHLPVLVAIRRVVSAIAQELETPADYKRICDELAKAEYEVYEGELELLVESLFQNTIGLDSKTAKVFKTLTQSIIHTATFHIKANLKTDIMTGDVRGPDGWQIVVLFAHDVINVTHRRREKSLDSLGPKHQFWYEWVLHMVFDKRMGDLASSSLRISDIGYGPDIDPSVKETVATAFGDGNMIIA